MRALIALWPQNFRLFDKEQKGKIPTSEMATVLRACGQNPTEAEMTILIQKVPCRLTSPRDVPVVRSTRTAMASSISMRLVLRDGGC